MEYSDIIDEYIIQEGGVNIFITTDKYENIYTHTYYCFGSSKSLTQFVTAEYYAIR